MTKGMKGILSCPTCKKPVEASSYMNPGITGMLDSVLPIIECECGYRGLPILLSLKDYAKWRKKSG